MFFLGKKYLAKYMKGVSNIEIIIRKTKVPSMNVNKTVLNFRGSGLNIIQAKILNIVLSIREEIIVERLFRNQRNLFLVIIEIFS